MTSGRTLKVGIIGSGKMGKHHIKTIQLQDCADIIGVADPQASRTKLRELFKKEPEIYSSAEELLKAAHPDVVHITTPPSTHFELAKLALTYGANIYVEKPFVLKQSEAEEVFSLAQEKGLRVCPGHQVLFEDPAIKTRQALKDIGQIVHIESYFSFQTVRRNITPVDQLIDILPHPVYLLLHFLNMGHNSGARVGIDALDVKASGEVRSLIRAGDATGVLIVTLRGRPIESYLRIVGTNGSLYADFVRGIVIELAGPGASAIPIVFSPYKQAKQLTWKSTKSFAGLAFKKQKSYPGLAELVGAFYSSIINSTPAPITPESVIQTVGICESITDKLRETERDSEKIAEIRLRKREIELPQIKDGKRTVLVTGGTGFLGRKVVAELRNHGWPVRVIARRIPPFSAQIPGIQYAMADLAESIPVDLLNDIEIVVHCAAETDGGKEAHEINSIRATKNIIEASIKAGIKKIIHISSVAVLKTGGILDENSPVDLGNNGRGPYVWGKAESENLACRLGLENGMNVKIIRLGPLVDYKSFQAPGRLGREIGNTFVAIGSAKDKLSLCDVHTAAEVIRAYVGDFESAPPVLNLVEPDSLTRGELVNLLLDNRSDLKVWWMPHFVLKLASPLLMLIQKLIFPKKKPINIYAAFASEKYKTELAVRIIRMSREVNTA